MSELANQSCEACQAGAPKLTDSELQNVLNELPEWQIQEVDGVKQLVREYKFKNFVKAMDFAVKVGEVAEEHNHHPELTVTWGETKVVWWTHKINGLHHNDSVMAAKTDGLYA